jgi:hypothetical protein
VFSSCAKLGGYADPTCGCDCCPDPLSELAREINIGPSMFLMSTKEIMKFFFLLSLLNIPSYLFYHQAQHEQEPTDIVGWIASMNMGQLGEEAPVCGKINTAR